MYSLRSSRTPCCSPACAIRRSCAPPRWPMCAQSSLCAASSPIPKPLRSPCRKTSRSSAARSGCLNCAAVYSRRACPAWNRLSSRKAMARTSEVIGGKGRVFTDEDASHISRIEELSYDLKIREVMTTDLIVVSPKMKMQDVLELLRQGRISGAPVVWQGKLVGLISLEDLIRSMVNHELHKNVEDYMTRDVITVK